METNLKSKARLTGLLYLLVIICAGFSQGYARGTLFIPGDASATLNNIVASEGLFRLGLATDLIAFLIDTVISILLYQLLKSAGITLALISTAFRLIAHPTIASLNLLNHFMALRMAQDGFGMGLEQKEAWTMIFMNAHSLGYQLAGAFFGIHCLILGILMYRSGKFPKVFGVLMVVASAGYITETFGNILFPGHEYVLANVVGFSAAIGEVLFMIYLLAIGVKSTAKAADFT